MWFTMWNLQVAITYPTLDFNMRVPINIDFGKWVGSTSHFKDLGIWHSKLQVVQLLPFLELLVRFNFL